MIPAGCRPRLFGRPGPCILTARNEPGRRLRGQPGGVEEILALADNDPITLLRVLALVAVVLAGGWVVATLALKLEPRATAQFAVANLLLVGGTLLETHRGQANGYLTFQGADMLELVAITLLRSGMQHLERIRITWREHIAVPALAGIAMAAIPPHAERLNAILIVYGLATSWITLRLYVESMRSLRPLLGGWAAFGILWPSAFFGLAMLLRCAWFLTHISNPGLSADVSIRATEDVLLLWMVCVILLASNMSLIGLVVGRLMAVTRDLARRDTLTGVYNRRVLDERLATEHERMRRGGPGFAVAMIDLDHFKAVNDSIGHAGGDAALRHVTQVIGALLRTVDTLARYGGEEFVVIFGLTDLNGAMGAAERMRAKLAATPFQWSGRAVTVTASMGVAAWAGVNETTEGLLRRADQGVYAAKDRGRNRVVAGPLYVPAITAVADQKAV